MNKRVFLDTNILVYSKDEASPFFGHWTQHQSYSNSEYKRFSGNSKNYTDQTRTLAKDNMKLSKILIIYDLYGRRPQNRDREDLLPLSRTKRC